MFNARKDAAEQAAAKQAERDVVCRTACVLSVLGGFVMGKHDTALFELRFIIARNWNIPHLSAAERIYEEQVVVASKAGKWAVALHSYACEPIARRLLDVVEVCAECV